ncbi:glycoside hydrolase family 43 protein [Polymorphobacter multimanifer]|uniref:Beta-xylosidase n=1 Tax=Polymorphobacter multimanifer TaxID=1070431 RepID=A0A841LFN1_9SPHN|nr:glycoside hydrolase family 43 protein [Polymorphobacter multimanifer]MBB6227778.1 beta-xylosidase [Polymorphobacter multimanifer]
MLAISATGCAAPDLDSPSPAFVPVYAANFPDPFILPHNGRFLAYATNAERLQANVQMAVSDDLVSWAPLRRDGKLHDAMPELPRWAQQGWTWAPEVMQLGGRYLMYFTARERTSQRQCTGVAHSNNPRGPFVSEADEPLLCQRELGGTIDANPFQDADGQLYLYFKPDANAVGKPTEIMVQRLTPDGLQLVGEQELLLRNDKPWEAHVIEAPTMVRQGDSYILFYSANHFGWEKHQRLSPYAIGHARCDTPMGPCTEAPGNPLLQSVNNRQAGCLSGPGHQAIFEAGGRQYMVFHAHAARPGCRNAHSGRQMYVAPLLWQDGEPVLGQSLRPRNQKL